MSMKNLTLLCLLTVFISGSGSLFSQKNQPKFYNETLTYFIQWKGMTVGSVKMKSKVKDASKLQVAAQVNSIDYMKGIYHVQGTFGSTWNYVNKQPVYAFEEAYQGDTYQNRTFRFSGKKVTVEKHEKKFSEVSYPHKGPLKNEWTDKFTQDTKGFMDLLGAFYKVRSTGKIPKTGEVLKVPVLPAGSYRYLVLKVLSKEVRNDVPVFGTREIMHVRTALASVDKKNQSGANLFFNTQSQIDMWITADADFIPVKIWTDVPIIGRAYIIMDSYTQP